MAVVLGSSQRAVHEKLSKPLVVHCGICSHKNCISFDVEFLIAIQLKMNAVDV